MAIVKSNSPGTITFSSSNENIVSLDGSVADPEGAGTAIITINQAETANYNAATATFNINVIAASRPPLDSDGDGVPDENDFVPDDRRIWSRDQFSFDTDVWGESFAISSTTNGKLKEFYGNSASGYITPELDNSPIGWDNKITWKARTDLSWVTFTKTSGTVVELERGSDGFKNVATRGDKATFTIAENNSDDDREGYVYIDYYYDGKFIKTIKEEIKQNDKKTVEELSDGTNIPSERDPDQSANVCSTVLKPVQGGEAFPQKIEVNIGSGTGTAEFYFNAEFAPDRFVLVHDGEIKFDSGYVTQAGGFNIFHYQTLLNNALSARGLPTATIVHHSVYGSGYEGFFTSWEKTSSYQTAEIYVYAPVEDTVWETAVSCPNQNLDNIRNGITSGQPRD